MIKEAPKTIRYGRCFRIKLKNEIKLSYLNLNVFNFGLKAVESGWLDSVQLNSILRLIKVLLKKKTKVKLNCSLLIPITKKPLETRMGSGKGERKFWKCPVSKGMILLELGNLTNEEACYVLNVISQRLPFYTKIIRLVY